MTGRPKVPLFDAVIFTAGLHDTYRNRRFTNSDERVRAQAMQEYGDALASVLSRLADLAPDTTRCRAFAHCAGTLACSNREGWYRRMSVEATVG